MLLMAVSMGGHHVFSQSVTITLMPGWNWISCPMMDTLDFETAMGTFTPVSGDVIKSRWGQAIYNGNRWMGTISQFYPGYGYMYKSNRTMPVMVTFNAQQPSQQVVVTTDTPQFITAISAMGGGEVTTLDGTYILAKGLCWATHENPTTNDDDFVDAGSGVGPFSAMMTGLNISTTYFVRAYTVTADCITYGDQKVFTTRNGIPEVSTGMVTDIRGGIAFCDGTVTDDGGLNVIARGVCWSLVNNPTVNDSHTIDGSGIGSFTSIITGLSSNSTYYVRAYASTSQSITYGEELSFTTLDLPMGAVDGLFSVNDTLQVYFSQGNLQYIGSANTPIWKFADNQWDYFGASQNGDSQTVNRDLFRWGTSGYDHGAVCYQPWSTSTNDSDYYAYGLPGYNLYEQTGMADWGYNPIINGGNELNRWRTLSANEWSYVFNTRTTESGIRYAKAQVNNINGVILLPDNWDANYYTLNYTNQYDAKFYYNSITESQWSVLEQYGAVFLPAAGYLSGTSSYMVGSYGMYWSATSYGNDASRVLFEKNRVDAQIGGSKSTGFSVRLVYSE